jgi:hypothetical protein
MLQRKPISLKYPTSYFHVLDMEMVTFDGFLEAGFDLYFHSPKNSPGDEEN